MSVYVVMMYVTHEESSIEGIFSTRELARERLELLEDKKNITEVVIGTKVWYDIIEYDLDK